MFVVCVCVLRHAGKKEENPYMDSDTPPCVHSKRPRVCQHHAHMCFNMCAWCQYSRVRFECTHGGVFESTYGGSRRQFCLPRKAHVEFSLGTTEVHQRNPLPPSTTMTTTTITTSTHNTQHTETQRHRDTEIETKTQVKRTICTSDTFHDVRLKKPSTFHNGFMVFCYISYVYLHIYVSSRTPQHSTWNCVGENRPQHRHMYSLVACV